jgi:hypothetical protein
LKKLELEQTWNFKLLFPHIHKVRWRGGTNLKSMNQNDDEINNNKISEKQLSLNKR